MRAHQLVAPLPIDLTQHSCAGFGQRAIALQVVKDLIADFFGSFDRIRDARDSQAAAIGRLPAAARVEGALVERHPMVLRIDRADARLE